MKIIKLLITAFIFIPGLLNAQTDFRPGYIIQLNGDTLTGEIDYRGDLLMGNTCRFKAKGSNQKTAYSPYDIDAYRFNGSKYFVSKEVNGKKLFLEFLIQGEINIFYLRDENGDHYYLEKDTTGIVEIPYEEKIMEKDHTKYFYQSTKHIGILTYYMQGSQALRNKIVHMGKPEHETLIKLAEDYHNEVCKDHACMIYEKKKPSLIPEIEIVGGMVHYAVLEHYFEKSTFFTTGVIAHFWLPRSNENLFFKTGLLYSKLTSYKDELVMIKVPIQIEYRYPKGIVRPTIALGINNYLAEDEYFMSVALMGGLNIKLCSSFDWRIQYEMDFSSRPDFSIIPKKRFSETLSSGLLFRF